MLPRSGNPGRNMTDRNATCASRWTRFLPGVICAGVYLVIALPSSLLYLANPHEYSIPMLIVVYLSFPVQFILFEILKSQTAFIERLPGGEIISLGLLLALTASLYFLVGQGVWLLWKKWKTRKAS